MLRFTVLPNVAPLSVLLLKNTLPLLKSCHTTYKLFPDLAICTLPESVASLLKFIVVPKVFPPSVLLLNNMSPDPVGVVWSIHTTYTMLPYTSTNGLPESPALLLRFLNPPKVIAVITEGVDDREPSCIEVGVALVLLVRDVLLVVEIVGFI